MHLRSILFTALVAGLAAAPARADGPIVTAALPRGGQQGSELTLTLYGRNLTAVRELLFFRSGIDVLEIKEERNRATARLRLAADCPLGEHPFQVRTDKGLSNLETFWVGTLAEVNEKEPNSTRDQAQKIGLAVTVNGQITAEDVDVFALDVPAPMRLNFEVQGVRLGDRDFDPHLSVLAADGTALAEVEDTPWGRMDPWCSVQFPRKGTYLVKVRESAFGGDSGCFYRLHVGRFPRPVATLPAGGRPGETLKFTYLGADGSRRPGEVTLPAAGSRGHRHCPRNEHGAAPTPLLFAIRDVPNTVEPLDRKDRDPIAFSAPGAVHGVIAAPNDLDRWRFAAKKGQRLEILVLARRLRSPLDPVLSVRQLKGDYRAYNDDFRHPDSRIDFRAPADGEYEIAIRDQLQRGGPDFAYRIEIAPQEADLQTSIARPGLRDQLPLDVPRGGRMATVVSTRGIGAGGLLALADLPAGVTATIAPVVQGSNLVPVVLAAKADAALAGSLARVQARLPKAAALRDGNLQQYTPLVRVFNNQPYLYTVTHRVPVAVTAEAPFAIDLQAPAVPIVQGGPMQLKVTLRRADKFTAAVRVSSLWTPPGLGIGSITIPAGKSEGVLSLSANDNAAPQTWQLAVVGTLARNGGRVEASSKLVELTVAKPWLTAKPGKARAEQGSKTELTFELARAADFTARFKAELLNLPPGVTTTQPEIDQDTRKVSLPLTLAADARVGRHRGMVLRLRIPTDAGEVWHYVRGAELRIDKPLPPRRAAPKAAPTKPAPKAAPTKPAPKAAAKAGAKGTIAKPKT